MGKTYKVLLVEDNEPIRTMYKEEFLHCNFEVVEAEDGEIAVNAAIQHLPDIILLDLMLPKQGGLSVLKILRSHPETKDTPVVILTALPNPEYQDEAGDKVQGYFLKIQVKPRELVNKVRSMLDV